MISFSLVTALTLPTVAETSVATSSVATTLSAPSTMSADEVLAQITDANGTIRFDIAEDGKRFVWDKPVFDDGLPAHGATYISQGYIYPEGTLSAEVDGVNADG
ncbi:MAG: hypothetical protein KC442_20275, partial [Thermomicrobiales bacterium]|nr:hypothetical protein [Thermomicrobiales bacterium]